MNLSLVLNCSTWFLISCFLLSWSFEFKPLSPKIKALLFNAEYAKLELTGKFGFIQPNYHLQTHFSHKTFDYYQILYFIRSQQGPKYWHSFTLNMVHVFGEIESQSKQEKLMSGTRLFTIKNPPIIKINENPVLMFRESEILFF